MREPPDSASPRRETFDARHQLAPQIRRGQGRPWTSGCERLSSANRGPSGALDAALYERRIARLHEAGREAAALEGLVRRLAGQHE